MKEPIDRKASVSKGVAYLLTELVGIEKNVLSTEDYILGNERISRWKDRAIEYLKQNVSDAEANRLQKKRNVLIAGNARSSFIQTAQQYRVYTGTLLGEIENHPEAVLEKSHKVGTVQAKRPPIVAGKRIFIVHGREEGIKYQVARFLEKSGLEAVILHEKPSQSKAIIEKLEKYSDVAYAVVLLTPDDVGKLATERTKPQSRARQNVIFELGFFMGKLGRDRVCVLWEGGVELPSDFKGVVYIPLDRAGAWKMSLAKELKAVGLEVNFDKAI
ncbi:hypothetical protein E3J95_03835 [Candidatus Aerophobetes bacterium]|uniref:CD-NTase-associated protein 12/Pycsar effector protein TIR domain-containing protein n=1 Tax=Aerophobetes bacterium TaxID=2030807 RepID=A0A523QJA9_UNCAE|nr:MAG: hypothetical protein E3J95_03835 [Candidatus Aerophobetes bacterium]